MLAILLICQIVTGLLLLLYYVPRELEAFTRIDYITRESTYGIFFRAFHLNCASFLFVFLYIHAARGLYYYRFRLVYVWFTGSILILVFIIVAFLGYVLPMGQMSFWGATVITNLVSVVPYVGEDLVL
jgi:ubiquinol-cytochrome c reductase cytochrome b subunit